MALKHARIKRIVARACVRFYRKLLRTVAAIPLLVAVMVSQETKAPADGGLSERTVRQIVALLDEKQQRTPTQKKLSSDLLDARRTARGQPGEQNSLLNAERFEWVSDGVVTVDIRAEVTPEVLVQIRKLGGTVINSVGKYRAIRARLPLDAVERLAELSEIRSIRTAIDGFTHVRPARRRPEVYGNGASVVGTRSVNTSQGDVAHQANLARQTHGVDGTGIGIGVISNGVKTLAARQASGDLPDRVTVLSGQAGSGDEGTALLEIVHDLAPGADLYFATANGGKAQFAANIEALCEAGADVIVNDIRYFSEAAFQDGIVAQGVNAAVAAGCVYFSAAGNAGNLNDNTSGVWEGDYLEGTPLTIDGHARGVGHDFGAGDEENLVTHDTPYGFGLQWSNSLGNSFSDYDLFLVNASGDLIAASTTIQFSSDDPIEFIDSRGVVHTNARLIIVKDTGSSDLYLRLSAVEGRLEHATAGNMFGHSAASNTIAVAAVDVDSDGSAFDGTESVRTSSSDGPRRIFFQPDGSPITPGNFSSTGGQVLEKPDLAAASCVSTATPGFGTFCGTSAAAPHAAAIAALMLESAGGPNRITREALLTAMTGAALDIEATGTDRDSGAGIVMAPDAVSAVAIAEADRNGAPTADTNYVPRVTTFLHGNVDTFDLAPIFSDPDNDALTYTAVSSNTDSLRVSLSGSMLTIRTIAPGQAVVTVRATDPGGLGAVWTGMFLVGAGSRDYDTDNDRLIEIASIAQLNATRYDLDGNGEVDGAKDIETYVLAFPEAVSGMGCPGTCAGYELTADLDFDSNGSGAADSGDSYWNDGAGWQPIGEQYTPFAATFDGNGKTISNLYINRPDTRGVGLFGYSDMSCVIRHLGVVNSDVAGNTGVGGLAGNNEGTIIASYATGRISGEYGFVGGLVGSNIPPGIIAASYATGSVSGGSRVGGLVGNNTANLFNEEGTITASYAAVQVSGDFEVGGLAGTNDGAITASYATGRVSGESPVGGLVGHSFNSITASYWDTRTSGHIWTRPVDRTALRGEGKGTAELQAPTGYTGIFQAWNLDLDGDGTPDDPWDFGTTNQYPVLSVDVDGNSQATWQEFGYQLRNRPILTASTPSGQAQVVLAWTEVDESHWNPAPGVTYSLIRNDGTDSEVIAEDVNGLQYTDSDVTLGATYTYRVDTLVQDVMTKSSVPVSVNVGAGNQPPQAVGTLQDQALRVTDGNLIVDVSKDFLDAEGDVLTFQASSSATSVATVSISGAEVTVTAVSEGQAVITVTATDAAGSNTGRSLSFTVTVSANFDTNDDGLVEIETLAQLDAIRHDLDGNGVPGSDGELAYTAAFSGMGSWMVCGGAGCNGYELVEDLDLDTNGNGVPDVGDTYWNNGAGWLPIGAQYNTFETTFDGNGRTISNLYINAIGSFVGLFGWAGESSVLRNLGIIDVDIRGTRTVIGGLVGYAGGAVTSSYATGRVTGAGNVGGLAGAVVSSVGMTACFSTVLVTGSNSTVGGLVGTNGGPIIASYATGRVSGTSRVGGLAGVNFATIAASYATGPVTGDQNTGGLVGLNEGTITASYWDTSTSGQTTGSGGRTTSQLQSPTGYSGIYGSWNVDVDGDNTRDSPWHFGTRSQYPVLSVDVDGSDVESWQEFGYQLREGPTLTAASDPLGAALSWTEVETSHWTPAPEVTYTLYREEGDVVETLLEGSSALQYTDTEVMVGDARGYQVAAVVAGGEGSRSTLRSLVVMDVTPPTVATVEIGSDPGSDGIYAAGDEIAVTVTFSEPVVVSRRPQLMLEIGGEDRAATYVSGTGTEELVFAYRVADGVSDDIGVTIGADSLRLNGGTIRDEAGNPAVLTHGAEGTFGGHRVDAVKPELVETDGAVVDTAILRLTYSEPLDGTSVPPESVFTVTGGNQRRAVTGLAVLGRTVELTLEPEVEHGETGIRVSYRVPTRAGESPLRDTVGNAAARLSNQPVTNETPDTTPPEVSKLEISSNPGSDRTYAAGDEIRVTVTFNEKVEVTGRPGLQLEFAGGSRTAAYRGGAGTEALVFGYQVAQGESDTDGVGVEADSLSGGTIRDVAQNPGVLNHEGVSADAGHRVDGVRPELAASGGAVVSGTTLTLIYDEPLDRSSTPERGDFTVSGGDQERTLTRVSVSGRTVGLTLDGEAKHGETGIRVSYTPWNNPIRDVAGNEAEGLSRQPVTNETPDTTSPEVSNLAIISSPGSDRTYAAGDEIEVEARFSETVEVTGTPQLRLRVGTRTRSADYESGTDTMALVFAYEVADGDADTDGVSLVAGRIVLNGGSIKDEAENAAEPAHEAVATDMGHQVDGVRPGFVSAAVDGASLTLTYREALDGGSEPSPGDFTVTVGGNGRSANAVDVDGTTVTLTLNPEVEHGDTGIRVSYTVPTGVGANPIRDEAGNDARALSNRSVTNTTDAPNTEPQITTGGTLSVGENQVLVRRLAARDSDAGDEVTGWEIVGGADQGQFSITSDRGELSFQTAPNYEDPVDVASTDPVSAAGDNEYVVTVEVKSGAGARELEAELTFIVRVTDEREPPEVPEAPVISGETADSLTVSWSEPNNTGPDITAYGVQYREKDRGGFTGVAHDGPGLTTTLSDLEPGTDYEVQVRAGNDEGTSDWSASGEGMTIALLTLELVAMEESPVSGAFAVRFSFSEPVTGFNGNDVDSVRDPECTDDLNNPVFCEPGIGGLQTADDRVFTTTVTPQTGSVAHSYTLRLTVPAGRVNSSVGNKANEEPEEPLVVRVSPPGAPEPVSTLSLGANGTNGSIRLNWNRPSDSGGSPIIRYEYRYQGMGDGWSGWESVGGGSNGVTVGGLINGREYVFEVRAVNALGKGGVETVTAMPVAGRGGGGGGGGSGGGGSGGSGGGGGGGGFFVFPPDAPVEVRATAGDGVVRLEWSPPESDGGTIIRGYEYRLKEGLEAFGEWTPIEDSRPEEVNATGYTVEGLFNGTVYVVELRAVNSAGNGPASAGVEVRMRLDPAWWSNLRAEDLEGGQLWLEAPLLEGGSRERELRFGEGLRFEQDRLDQEGEVTGTVSGSYGYVYTSRRTGEMRLVYDGGERCGLSLTFSEEGGGSYSYGCGGVLEREGSFGMSRLNRAPGLTSTGPFEVEENTTAVGQLEGVDWDEEDEVTGYGVAGGADAALFRMVAETGELRFKEAPDYENPGDVASDDPHSEAADNEYIVVVEVTSGEGERERRSEQTIRVRVIDVEDEEGSAQDPSAFTEEDLEGRRLSLRQTGEEGTTSLQLRFGGGNRFEEIRQEAATPAGTALHTARAEAGDSRSGTYAYERTGPGMGTLRLDYDDGTSCELRLHFSESGVGGFSYNCGEGVPAEGSFRLTTGSLFVPVILSSAGQNQSFFTSELTLTNRGEREAKLDYSYTAHRGGGSGRAQEVLEAGRQRIETNALTYLRDLGVPIAERGNRIGTLRVGVELGSEVEAVVRTTTVVADGRAGLAYLGVAEEEGFDEPVYLCGLRQNSRDRSNLAFQNMGAPGEGEITIRTTVYSGDEADARPRVLREVDLEPGGFHQFSPVLGAVANGYVKVERVDGTAPFYAYGVINDQVNSDGSFVFPVTASSLEGKTGQTLPVIVETRDFTSELTVTNFSEQPRTLEFEFVSEQIQGEDKRVEFGIELEAGEQAIVPELVEALRREEMAKLGTSRGFFLGPLFVRAEEGDLSGIVVGARTGSKGGGGTYSVFYNAVPEGEGFEREAWVEGLQQNEENRSNLALVNTGEVDGSESVFHLEIYNGETGMLEETVVTRPIPARGWHQIDGILLRSSAETRQGYIRIEKMSGENPFLAYGVVNDGGAPGERSGDGAYLPARE